MSSDYSRPSSLEDILGRPIVLNTMAQWIKETKELSKKPLLTLRLLRAMREDADAKAKNSEARCYEMELNLAKRYARVVTRTKNPYLKTLFRRYLRTALIAQEIARWTNYIELEMAFFAGLSHDIGKLVIGLRNPRALKEIWNLVDKGLADRDAEKIILGFEHSELGARLLEKWRMSDALVEMARHHLVLRRVRKKYRKLALILGLSNFIVRSLKEQNINFQGDWSKAKSRLRKLDIKMTFEEWNVKIKSLFEEIVEFEEKVFA